MASRKEHHYIPQFYLRNFSTDISRKLIGVYNDRNAVQLYHAAIKNQAREKYFYGTDDKLESMLSKVEQDAARFIANILETETVPVVRSNEYHEFLYFLLFQHTRTKRAEAATNAQLQALENFSYGKFGQKPPLNPSVSVVHILLTSLRSFKLAGYLRFQLLINDTKVPFITSDNPVVMNNELMETLGAIGQGTGWACKGLQVFYPISPKYMLIWTDPSVYRSGGKIRRLVFRTQHEQDVMQLNALQYLNCHEQLFFNQSFTKPLIKQLLNKYRRMKIDTVPKTFGAGSLSIVLGYEYRINLKLSFNKIDKRGSAFRLDNRLVHFRHPSFAKIREEDPFNSTPTTPNS